MNLARTPVHCFTIYKHGEVQHLLIDGGYCDFPSHEQIEADHPGWVVTDHTWRADWTQLAAPGNSEPGYSAGQANQPVVSHAPWA